MLAAAMGAAQAIGHAFSVAIVDPGGHLKAFVRMDRASLGSVQVAMDKALTAVRFGRPTHAWFDLMQSDPQLAAGAPTGIDRLIVFEGGLPIQVDGAIVGAIGVSGAHHSDDRRAAEEAIEALRAG